MIGAKLKTDELDSDSESLAEEDEEEEEDDDEEEADDVETIFPARCC
jgi:hypothetical protein